MNYDVTVIGEIYLDHVFSGFASWPSPGEEIFTEQYTWELGGGAVTTACALARLGRRVQLIGVVGTDQLSAIEDRLEDFGVRTDNLMSSSDRSGVTVSISTTQDRSFFTYRGANRQLPQMLRDRHDLLNKAAQSRHVHLAMPLSADDAAVVLPALRQHGATTSIDVGHHVTWLEDKRSLDLVRAIDYVMPNEKEAVLVAGSPEGYLELCRSLGVRHALVKLGAVGAVMLSEGREYRAAPPEVETMDTTGAGDAFDAGFLDAMLAGLPPKQWIEHGCVTGALSTRAAGALQALPTREEAAAVCEENYAT
jgi:sugar/nucleoside kinase (ribokinase family)